MSQLFRKKSIDRILAEAARGELADAEHGGGLGLKRSLSVTDLTALGIAAIIGAGIFSTIGTASAEGGPAVVFLFLFTAIACGFSALCYAEFASAIPISGSAYTYAYASFGELVAWIIGWDLLMEYAIGNITVAISWSDYFTGFLAGFGWHIPYYLTMDYLTASSGYTALSGFIERLSDPNLNALAQSYLTNPSAFSAEAIKPLSQAFADYCAQPGVESFSSNFGLVSEAYLAYQTAPHLGLPLIFDLPAVVIVILITALIYVGISESKTASNIFVALKLAVIFFVIVLGAFYVKPENWSPFSPEGFGGVMKGVSAVFFAYIGFDAISTTAEEAKNPRRDLPRAMIYALIICTVLYILISLVLTGLVPYKTLNVGDPLAFALTNIDMPVGLRNWVVGIVAFSAVVAMSSVLLVFQMGQPRIWLSMSRDGLLPPIFARIHKKFRTPSFSTVLTGFVVGVPCFFMNLSEAADLTSIGTLFAFVLVCGGILKLQVDAQTANKPTHNPSFKVPYINGQYLVPLLFVGGWVALLAFDATSVADFFLFRESDPKVTVAEGLYHRFPLFLFVIIAAVMSVLSYWKKLSLLPVLGLLSCFYLMSYVNTESWIRFLVWLVIGQAVYFIYGYSHSKLKNEV